MKSQEEAMQILEAYDLTGSLRAAAVSHHTVARYVTLRDGGRARERAVRRERLTDAYLAKIEEWTEPSRSFCRHTHPGMALEKPLPSRICPASVPRKTGKRPKTMGAQETRTRRSGG